MNFEVIVKRIGVKKTRILEQTENTFAVEVSEPAESGKANRELERFFTKFMNAPVTLKLGKAGKKKLFSCDKQE
ncbi:MAG: DUF167 domain-containing protein [Candidatus Woesearchaeota archaeon]|nr:MAG: DUF167 domain-containing protein [Candidatus Woesearchaeota archaeon]